MSLRRRLARTLSVVAAATLLVPLAQAPASAGPGAGGGYIALGDSVPDAYGVAPGEGFVRLLADQLGLHVRNASVSGATTTSLIEEQLPRVLPSLRARNSNKVTADDVRLITVTIGGNDVFRPVIAACAPGFATTGGLTDECTSTVALILGQLATNYTEILGELRAAAGPTTTIAVMTYYNSLLEPCEFSPLAALAPVILGEAPGTFGLNDVIRGVAASPRIGARVVSTFGAVGGEDLQGDCLHPDASGHQKIAAAFAAAVAA